MPSADAKIEPRGSRVLRALVLARGRGRTVVALNEQDVADVRALTVAQLRNVRGLRHYSDCTTIAAHLARAETSDALRIMSDVVRVALTVDPDQPSLAGHAEGGA